MWYGISKSEVVVPLGSGNLLVTDSYENNPEGSSYIRIVDPNGGEIAYWSCDEWADEPQCVMGAIVGAMLLADRVDPDEEPDKFYRWDNTVNFPEEIVQKLPHLAAPIPEKIMKSVAPTCLTPPEG